MLRDYKGTEDNFTIGKPSRHQHNQVIPMDIISMEQLKILYYLIRHNEKKHRIIAMLLFSKRHSLNLIMREQKTNTNLRIFYVITG